MLTYTDLSLQQLPWPKNLNFCSEYFSHFHCICYQAFQVQSLVMNLFSLFLLHVTRKIFHHILWFYSKLRFDYQCMRYKIIYCLKYVYMFCVKGRVLFPWSCWPCFNYRQHCSASTVNFFNFVIRTTMMHVLFERNFCNLVFPFLFGLFSFKNERKACVTVRLHYYIIDQGVCALVNLTFSNLHIESLHLKFRIKCDDMLFWT